MIASLFEAESGKRVRHFRLFKRSFHSKHAVKALHLPFDLFLSARVVRREKKQRWRTAAKAKMWDWKWPPILNSLSI